MIRITTASVQVTPSRLPLIAVVNERFTPPDVACDSSLNVGSDRSRKSMRDRQTGQRPEAEAE